MRRHNSLHAFVGFQPGDIDILIGRPATAENDHRRGTFGEFSWRGVAQRALPDIGHTVETRVAGNRDIVNSGIGEQLPRNFILHVQAIVTPQIATESIPQRAEEPLTRTKDCRDYIGRYVTAAYSLKIVVPEFVLYEHHHLWLCGIKECFYIAGSVERQVCRSHPRVEVVAHCISRRGKECEQNPAPGIRREQTLDERSALLEFSKRCGMYPQSISPPRGNRPARALYCRGAREPSAPLYRNAWRQSLRLRHKQL